MSTLIIHPKDSTTDFLKPIYAPLKNKTILTGGVTKQALKKQIDTHDQILMLGHGSPMGLFSVNRFANASTFIIDESVADLLRKKTNNIFIWCHSNLFVRQHGLAGFNSGMFISELGEAFYCGLNNVDWKLVKESNDEFASIVSRYINQPLNFLYENVLHEYGDLAGINPIARYNLERLYLN